jgi:putative chitinase
MDLTIGDTQKIIAVWRGMTAAVRNYSVSQIQQLAYILATAHHETGGKMVPVKERGGNAYFFKMYDPGSPDPTRARLAKKMGALPGDGILFPGRGHVQITWRPNYVKFGKILKIDLVGNPDLALEPGNSIQILLHGMIYGRFTGKKLSDYITDAKCDWVNARRIVNGTDCAEAIAAKAAAYYAVLSADPG